MPASKPFNPTDIRQRVNKRMELKAGLRICGRLIAPAWRCSHRSEQSVAFGEALGEALGDAPGVKTVS